MNTLKLTGITLMIIGIIMVIILLAGIAYVGYHKIEVDCYDRNNNKILNQVCEANAINNSDVYWWGLGFVVFLVGEVLVLIGCDYNYY